MEIIRLGHPHAPVPDNCITALGFFDGVHRGHRALLRRAVSLARARGGAPAVFTFDMDDAAYDKKSARRLTTSAERLALFEECGITHVFYADFSAVRDLSPADFVSRILVDACHTHTAVCGYNFRFGSRAAGTPAELKKLMHAHGGRISVVPEKLLSDELAISSSRIRVLICRGDMPTACAMLGRPYSITSPVLHGKALGRTIGIPTINQSFPREKVVPAYGVYDVVCEVDGCRYRGLANVGTRPTVGGETVNCETHLIDFDGDLYDRVVTTYFGRMLRREMRFHSLEELQAEIIENLKEMKRLYGNRMDKAYRPRQPRRPR